MGFAPSNLTGLRQPIDTAQDFVLGPLSTLAPTNPALAAALKTYNAASADQQNKWATNYFNAAPKVKFVNGVPVVPAGDYGPVPVMLASQLILARSGAIDTDLLAQRQFYGTDFTKPLLFLDDGDYYNSLAAAQTPDRRPVGRDERDRQLPWPALAVAVPDCGTTCTAGATPTTSTSSPST